MKPRDVAVLILEKEKLILLQKRSKTEKRFPDSWGLFGGGFKDGESPEQAIQREIKEELGFVLKAPMLVGTHPYELEEPKESGTVYVFRAFYDDSKMVLSDGQEMRWFSPEEALNLDLHPIYRAIIEEIVQNRTPVVS
jgi:8-oxo-dGTP pyrophosphatase MutT (NUDIX family)